jgi:hypothetical protein
MILIHSYTNIKTAIQNTITFKKPTIFSLSVVPRLKKSKNIFPSRFVLVQSVPVGLPSRLRDEPSRLIAL